MIQNFFNQLKHLADLVKISHSVFALPFALSAMVVASNGLPPVRVIFWIVVAMVTARNSAMSFNRFLDADIDAKNPRTRLRHIPQGIFSRKFVLGFSILNGGFFVWSAFELNPLCFQLSFPVLAFLFFYSYTKRFTALAHLVLGLALGLSPLGVWIAIRQEFALAPVLLGVAVVFWVAGFDMIYATQDYEFDRKEGLHSLVVRFGIGKSLMIARFFHGVTLLFFILFGNLLQLKGSYYLSLLLVASLLVYEHSLVKEKDLSRVNSAFFNINGYISLLFFAGVVLGL